MSGESVADSALADRRHCAPQCRSVQDCPPSPGPCQPAYCDYGMCEIASAPDYTNDPHNCGGCGNVCRASETCSAGACVCGSGPRCAANEACAGGTCVDACAPDGTAKCEADCGYVIGTSCYAGPESAVCITGGGAQFSDPTYGYVGLCVERIYGSSITDLSSGNYGYCIQVQRSICQPG